MTFYIVETFAVIKLGQFDYFELVVRGDGKKAFCKLDNGFIFIPVTQYGIPHPRSVLLGSLIILFVCVPQVLDPNAEYVWIVIFLGGCALHDGISVFVVDFNRKSLFVDQGTYRFNSISAFGDSR